MDTHSPTGCHKWVWIESVFQSNFLFPSNTPTIVCPMYDSQVSPKSQDKSKT